MNKILVVDDDQSILELIKLRMEMENFQVFTAMDSENALAKVHDEIFDLTLLDLKLNGHSGLDLMEDLHKIDPDMPVIILTGYGTIDSAVEAMRKGAFSYLAKPLDFPELISQIKDCLEKNELPGDPRRQQQVIKDRSGFDNVITKSEPMQKVMQQVTQAATTDSIVFITGESGTGKELIARNLHMASPRKDGPFVAINCAAIPENLLESELFGYEKGAFSGAQKRKPGLFAKAHGGTFFLDEISELPLSMQAKLLRVLEDKKIVPLGSTTKATTIDARILAVSNKNLEEEVKQGNFREDLFYRIHVISIAIPPLRDRPDDIPLLANHFLSKFSKDLDRRIVGFSVNALHKLIRHSWPGNVRELENAVKSAVIMVDDDVITEDVILSEQQSGQSELKPLKGAKEDFERNYLMQLLELTRGNISQASKIAGKYRADVYELLKKHNLNPADFRKE